MKYLIIAIVIIVVAVIGFIAGTSYNELSHFGGEFNFPDIKDPGRHL